MDKISGAYSRTNSYEQVTAPSSISDEFYYRFMPPDANNLYGLAPGETYTLSGSVSHTAGELKFRSQYSTNGSSWVDLSAPSDLGIPVSDGSTFTPFSHTFTVPANATGVYISLQNYDYTAGSLFRFKNMKLEKGSVATNWCLSQSELTTTTGSYRGVTLNDRGLTATAGSTTVAMNSNAGFLINNLKDASADNPGGQVFHVDTDGNLTISGSLTSSATISGVNFTGQNLTLSGSLKLTGDSSAISSSHGDVVFNKNGIIATSGPITVTINGTDPLRIQSNNNDIFKVDNKGSLTISGNLTTGDSPNSTISGVNFTGENLTLSGSMKVNGQILFANGAGVLSSQGLSLKGGGLRITSSDGKTLTTYIDSEGTFTTTKGVFTGNVTATSLTIPEGSSADINVGGKFRVNSDGDVTANSFTATDVKITGGQYMQGTFNSPSIQTGTLYGSHIYTTDLHGSEIYGGLIDGAKFENDTYQNYSELGGYIGEPIHFTNSDNTFKIKNKPTFNLYPEGNMVFADRYVGISSSPSSFHLSYVDGTVATLTYGIENGTLPTSFEFLTFAGDNRRNDERISPIRGMNYGRNIIGYQFSDASRTSWGDYDIDAIIPFAKITANNFISDMTLNYEIAFNNFTNYLYESTNDSSVRFNVIAWKSVGDHSVEVGSDGSITGMKKQELSSFKDTDYALASSAHVISNYGSYSDMIDLSSLEGNDIGIGIVISQAFHQYNYSLDFALNSFNWTSNNVGKTKVMGNAKISGEGMMDDSQKLTITPTGSIVQESEYFTGNSAYNSSNSKGGSFLYSSNVFISHGQISFNSTPINSMANEEKNYQLASHINGENIEFLPAKSYTVTDGSDRSVDWLPRLKFDGVDYGNNGVSFNSFGNIIGMYSSERWEVRDYSHNNVFTVPLDQDSPFVFNVPHAGWGGLKIGWVHFENWLWGGVDPGKVPAIYNDATHLTGIAIWDRYIVLFVDGWARNMTDAGGLLGGHADKVGVQALNKEASKPN